MWPKSPGIGICTKRPSDISIRTLLPHHRKPWPAWLVESHMLVFLLQSYQVVADHVMKVWNLGHHCTATFSHATKLHLTCHLASGCQLCSPSC